MLFTRSILLFSLLAFAAMPLGVQGQQEEDENEIPEELLDDEHLREELGVNKFTTPSIGRIFEDLRKLRPLPYDELKRPLPEQPPQDRTKLALSMGVLMANGFFAVEAEQFFDLEPVGRSLLNHGKVLGSGTRISSHMKSVLEKGAVGHWAELKDELVRTQRDVEREMVLIRDVDVANLIALGGWLRALEIACAASLNPYDPAKAATLSKPNVVEYFVLNLETLEPRVQDNPVVSEIRTRLVELQKEVDLPDGEILAEDEVRGIHQSIEALVDVIAGGERLIKSVPGLTDSTTTPAPVKTPAATGGVVSGEVPD
jgi:hypothetical protein